MCSLVVLCIAPLFVYHEVLSQAHLWGLYLQYRCNAVVYYVIYFDQVDLLTQQLRYSYLWSAEIKTHLVGIPKTIVGGILFTFNKIFSFPDSFLVMSWVARYWKCSWAVVRPACTAALFNPTKSLRAFFSLRNSCAGGADLHMRAVIK